MGNPFDEEPGSIPGRNEIDASYIEDRIRTAVQAAVLFERERILDLLVGALGVDREKMRAAITPK